MKKLLLLIAALFTLAAPAWAKIPPWSGTVRDVLDGDSLMRGREPIQLRLYGLDCPERRQPHADQAEPII